MEKTLDVYKAQQSKSLNLLERLSDFLRQGEELDVKIDPELKKKLQTVIHVASGKLKIALIGGFSEGKTAIAAAWMEKLDKSSMKISQQESSDAVETYNIGSGLELIDTPGLFGFKEKMNATTREVEKYKEITEKRVSEAHLVLYVMNSTNPVKDSHKEELHWLFRTLNLLPRTVFVLSRFDEVADVEDEQDYQTKLNVKRENVRSRLRDLIQLNDKEAFALSIVAVSANPFDMGVDHWLENLKQFKALSRISTLQEATFQKIQASGGHDALVAETRKSVIGDVLDRHLPPAIVDDEKISKEMDRLAKMIDGELVPRMNDTKRQIDAARGSLREFVLRYFTDLILQAKGTGLHTFSDFYESCIGSEGIVIATRLQTAFEKHLQSARLDVEKMQTSFNLEIDHFSSAITAVGKQGLGVLKSSGWLNRTTVLTTRDGIVSAGKLAGLDLGKLLKFKPYGAIKFAKGLNGALAVLGIALEAWDTWTQYQREEAFRNAIKKLVENFERQRKELLKMINGDQFVEHFFGDYIELEKNVQEAQVGLEQGQAHRQKFHAWREEAEAIDAEFRELSIA